MRLPFDQNLSPRLVQQLEDIFPDSTHLATVGMERATDQDVWVYARTF
jgi:predicted nuclease of predicted toxin-antitoxin system